MFVVLISYFFLVLSFAAAAGAVGDVELVPVLAAVVLSTAGFAAAAPVLSVAAVAGAVSTPCLVLM